MKLKDIQRMPVADLMEKDSVLLLWVTWPTLLQGLETAKIWGFTYKTMAFTWVKRTKNWKWHFGGGFWTRSNSEVCLLFTRGHPHRVNADVPSLIEARLGDKHSAKPPEVYGRIERLIEGPYLEIFGRETRPNWVVLGNEVNGKDIFDAMAEITDS